MSEPQATFLFLKVSGDQAVEKASDVLAKLLSGMIPAGDVPAAAADTTATTIELAEPAKRIESSQPRRKYKPRYKKPADEPNGFELPKPAAAKPTGIGEHGPRGGRPSNGFNKEPVSGGVGDKIVRFLGTTNGVAPMELLVNKLSLPPQSIGRAVGHSDELQRLPDGRIALAGYSDDD